MWVSFAKTRDKAGESISSEMAILTRDSSKLTSCKVEAITGSIAMSTRQFTTLESWKRMPSTVLGRCNSVTVPSTSAHLTTMWWLQIGPLSSTAMRTDSRVESSRTKNLEMDNTYMLMAILMKVSSEQIRKKVKVKCPLTQLKWHTKVNFKMTRR